MSKYYSIYLLCSIQFVLTVNSKTLSTLTNSPVNLEKRALQVEDPLPGYTTKTYDLEVPGSNPIRIVEADPIWRSSDYYHRPDVTTDSYFIGSMEHRSYKPDILNWKDEIHPKDPKIPFTTEQTKTTLNEPNTNRCYGVGCEKDQLEVSESNRRDNFSPDELNKFLNEYAEKVKMSQKNVDPENVEMLLPHSKKHSERIDNEGHEDKNVAQTTSVEPVDKSKSSDWDKIEMKRHHHPYDDQDGWVTLEAVPWAASKVSKWQSNKKPSNWYDSDRYHWSTKPDNGYNSNNGYNNNGYNNNGYNNNGYNKPHEQYGYNSKPQKPYSHYNHYAQEHTTESTSKPYWNKPHYSTYAHEYTTESTTKPSWNRPSYNKPSSWNQQGSSSWSEKPSKPNSHKYGHKDCDKDDPEIITDGKPSDFPSYPNGYLSHHNGYYRHPTPTTQDSSESSSTHHESYPENGDGQWVLLSTTKGYQYPKNRQRSLDVTPFSLSSRKSVHLTVLPAKGATKANSTKSHGGLLEVESTFETVDEARKNYIRKLKKNTTRRPNSNGVKPQKQASKEVDNSAVWAAVGAGMIPATMAMVMPMVLGRKRRSLDNNDDNHFRRLLLEKLIPSNVTQSSSDHFETTLQKSF